MQQDGACFLLTNAESRIVGMAAGVNVFGLVRPV